MLLSKLGNISGERVKVQLFFMSWNYYRCRFKIKSARTDSLDIWFDYFVEHLASITSQTAQNNTDTSRNASLPEAKFETAIQMPWRPNASKIRSQNAVAT